MLNDATRGCEQEWAIGSGTSRDGMPRAEKDIYSAEGSPTPELSPSPCSVLCADVGTQLTGDAVVGGAAAEGLIGMSPSRRGELIRRGGMGGVFMRLGVGESERRRFPSSMTTREEREETARECRCPRPPGRGLMGDMGGEGVSKGRSTAERRRSLGGERGLRNGRYDGEWTGVKLRSATGDKCDAAGLRGEELCVNGEYGGG